MPKLAHALRKECIHACSCAIPQAENFLNVGLSSAKNVREMTQSYTNNVLSMAQAATEMLTSRMGARGVGMNGIVSSAKSVMYPTRTHPTSSETLSAQFERILLSYPPLSYFAASHISPSSCLPQRPVDRAVVRV